MGPSRTGNARCAGAEIGRGSADLPGGPTRRTDDRAALMACSVPFEGTEAAGTNLGLNHWHAARQHRQGGVMSELLWRCTECGWVCETKELLTAPNPFDDNMTISGCPGCKEIGRFENMCNVPGCDKPATCGTPTKDGYKRLCGNHYSKLKPRDIEPEEADYDETNKEE